MVYSIKRCFTIFGFPGLTEKLKNWVSSYKKDPTFLLIWLFIRFLESILFFRFILQNKKHSPITNKTTLHELIQSVSWIYE